VTPPRTGIGGGAPGCLAVTSAVATGTTGLAAFHRALCQVDVGHYNLVRLSSVIPPGVTVAPSAEPAKVGGSWGDRLFCVYAEQRTSTPGEEAWAGVGWVQRLDGRGGLLVEHEGGSEGFVRDAVTKSLTDMVSCDPDLGFSAPEMVLAGGRCEDHPIAALVIVPFVSVPWVVEPS
jgi:arginine decarboxylase